MKKLKETLKRTLSIFVTITTVIWSIGIPFASMAPIAYADDPPAPQFWVNNMTPSGGGVSTTFSGSVYFSGAVNSATVSYSSATANSATVVLLEGRYDDYIYFDTWMQNNPDLITISDHDVETFSVAVNGTDSSRLDLTSSATLTDGTTYTILVKNVCASGHTTAEQNYWQYCPMYFQTFTTAGGASTGVAFNVTSQSSMSGNSLCAGTLSYFTGDVNEPLYYFNSYGNATLNSIKLYSTNDPSSIISQVKVYRDKTSSNNSNGNWTLEPGIDTLLASASSWSQEGESYTLTLDIAPDLTLPTTDPNGSLGFIALDIASGLTSGVTTTAPIVQSGSFTFAGSDGATLTTAMNTAITNFTCANPLINITSSAGQNSPYIQNLATSSNMNPNESAAALGIDFWNAAGATLQSITVDVIVPSGSGFDPQYGLASLAANSADAGINIYQDNKVSGAQGSYDGQDTRLALSAAPAWSNLSGTSKRATLTLSSSIALATTNGGINAGSDFFIVIKTSSSPAGGSSFQIRIPYDGVVTGFPAANSDSSIININSGGGMMGSNILISEIQTEGSEENDEFIELYNPTNAAVNLSSYSIQYRNAASGAFSQKNFAAGASIPAYGFYLIAPAEYNGAPNEDLTNDGFNLALAGGTVFLVNNQTALTVGNEATIVDKAAWGVGALLSPEGEAAAAPSANGSIERKSWYQATATEMASGGMDENMGNMEDSANNFMDFVVQATSVPQSTASSVENPMENMQGGAGSAVVINEVYYYPATGNTAWIELFNRSADTQTLTSWSLITQSQSTTTSTYIFPTYTMSAGSYTSVWWKQTGSDTLSDVYTSNGAGATSVTTKMSTLAGDITLKDNTSTIKDYLQYGAVNQPGEGAATSTGEWIEGHVVTSVLRGQSIGRKGANGDDSDRDDDWQTYSSPSEGSANSGGDNFPPDEVTAVTLTDADDCQGANTCNFGLNGYDVTVAWTANATTDPTFEKYLIYILPAATTLNVTVHQPFAQIYQGQTTATFTGQPGMTLDSRNPGVALATGSYRAYVVAQDTAGNRSSAVASSAQTLTAEGEGNVGADTQKPFIMHMGVWQAKTGADIVLVARIGDDRTLGAVDVLGDDHTNGSGVGAQIVWKAAASTAALDLTSGTTTTDCEALEADYVKCTIDSANAVQGQVVGYYFKSVDAATTPNLSLMSADWEVDMATYANNTLYENAVKGQPFIIDILAASNYTDDGAVADLSGTVYQSNGSVLQGAYFFIEGTAIGPVQTNSSGVFSLADDTMMPGSWGISVFKASYMDMYGSAFKGESTLTYYLNSGTTQMGGTGGGGYMEMPYVTYTNPSDGLMGVPIAGFSMTIGFSKPMNSNTIVDNNAANAGSNIYLTTNDLDRVAGAVSYSNQEATFTVASGTSLTPGTMYALVITTNVTDDMGNSISGGWRSDGATEATFTTEMNNDNLWGTGWEDYMSGGENYGQGMGGGGGGFAGMDFSNYGQGGQMMSPYVAGTIPQAGANNISRTSSIIVEFNEPMNSSSINSTNIKLYPIANQTTWAVGTEVSATISLDSATQKIVTINPDSILDLNSAGDGWYVVKIMGAVQSVAGVWMGNPTTCGTTDPNTCLASASSYEMSFKLNTNSSTASDTTNPTVLGTYPNDNDGITAGTVAADVGISSIEVGFSEPMSPSTINAQSIILRIGSNSVNGKVEYDAMSNMARFFPSSALMANSQYTLSASTSITDLSGNYLDQNSGAAGLQGRSISFKTGSADTTGSTLLYANADDYSIAITYSEPMNSAKQSDASKWTTSVLNPANYYVTSLATVGGSLTAVSPYSSAVQLSTLSGLSFDYDESTNTVIIKGFSFGSGSPAATDFQIFIDNVIDKSNNAITNSGGRVVSGSNATQGTLQSSADTYGMLGPGGPGMMMGPMGGGGPMGGPAGGASGPGMDMGSMGMMAAGAWPMNMMAGQTSTYFIDVPITKSIPIGGSIVLTFPNGFNVTNAAEDTNSPINNDINEWNTGTVTIDSVTGAQSARTVTIVTAGAATQATDFLHMDIKTIVNSSIPKEFGTSGYTVDIKTFNAAGVMLETISSMPFYLSQGGSNTISGTVTAADATTGTMTVFLGSPMTGPMEATANFSTNGNGTASYSFTNLPDGQFHVFTDPVMTINSNDYYGSSMPESIWLSGANAVKNITVVKESAAAGTAVTVNVTGDFRTNGSNDNVDIFANSYSNFRVKTVIPGNVPNGQNYTLYLPDGEWMVGIGPAMPKGAMSGPPTMPDWMPPMSVNVKVEAGAATEIIENSGTANDGALAFTIANQVSNTITGTVLDGSGVAIANAEVSAYQPTGGFGGSFTKTATDGSFTLKMPVLGMYKVGAYKPGLPNAKEVAVDVRSNGNYVNNTLIASLALTIKKPSYTISGKVLNANSQAVAYAPVWAYQQSSWGHADTMTDASGNYILYVDNGTWIVEADAKGVGWLQYELPITINGASQANINLQPDSDTVWIDISGTITINNSTQNYVPIRAVQYTDADTDGTPDYFNGREFGGMTDSSGQYTISVPGGSSGTDYYYYRVDIWTPDFGEVGLSTDGVSNSPANLRLANADVANADITIAAANLKTVTVQFANKADYANQEAFINIEGVSFNANNIPTPTNFHKSKRVNNISGADPIVSLVAGDYMFFVDVPGTGQYMPSSNSAAWNGTKGAITVDGTGDTVTFSLPDQNDAAAVITFSGTVSGPDSGQRNAWVWIDNPATGFHAGTTAATSTGAYSLKVPILSSGNYLVGADKPGFTSGQPTSNAGTANATINFTLTAQSQTISGYIFADAAGGTSDSFDTGEGIANGWAYAEEISTGAESHAPVDANGAFSLGVNNGVWKVYGMADGYSKAQYKVSGIPTTITVSSNSPSSQNIELATDANWTRKTKSAPVTPASGGVVDDTEQDPATGLPSGTGIKVTLPPNALGSDSSSGNITLTATAAVAATESMKPSANKGKSITATDNSGQPITNLDNYIDIEMVTYKAEIDAEVTANNIKDTDKLKTMKIGYWDETKDVWVNEPTVKKAYYKDTADTEWTMYNGTTTTSGYNLFIENALGDNPTFVEGTDYDDYKLVLTSSVNHLTVYAAGTSPDGVAPAAPTSVTQTSGSGTSVGLSWTAPTLNADASALTDLYGYAVYRSTDGTTYSQNSSSAILAGNTTYTDSSTTAFTSYYYKVTAGDDDNTESAYSTALQVCSTNTVSNGSVAADCSITCDSGYTQSGNTCASSAATTTGGGGISWTMQQQANSAAATAGEAAISAGGAETAAAPQAAPTASAQTTSNGMVTASAGDGGATQMTTDDGTTAKVIIPPAAVMADTTFSVSQIAVTETASGGDTAIAGSGSSVVPSAPSGKAIVGGRSYSVSALEYGTTAVTSLNDSLTLLFTYTDEQVSGFDESTLKIYYYNTDNDSWVSLTSTIDPATNTVTAYIDHLTAFAIIGALTIDPTVLEGKVIKDADSAGVYLVNQGYRRAFKSEMMYFSYGYTWSNVEVMNVDIVPRGPDMVYSDDHTFTAGQMVKGANEKVYFIDNEGVSHWVETGAAYLGLGYQWSQVAWISDTALAKYAEGSSITTSSSRPDGSLVKYADSDKVYLLDNGQKKWLVTEEAFNNHSYGWYNIIEIPDSEAYITGSNIYS
ncbi:Ig-like domain-containing protein [Patescibacteria group bacterium]|nr:Ig-like domain-containing protein [Patescibacteria group bacterium]